MGRRYGGVSGSHEGAAFGECRDGAAFGECRDGAMQCAGRAWSFCREGAKGAKTSSPRRARGASSIRGRSWEVLPRRRNDATEIYPRRARRADRAWSDAGQACSGAGCLGAGCLGAGCLGAGCLGAGCLGPGLFAIGFVAVAACSDAGADSSSGGASGPENVFSGLKAPEGWISLPAIADVARDAAQTAGGKVDRARGVGRAGARVLRGLDEAMGRRRGARMWFLRAWVTRRTGSWRAMW